MEFGHASGHLQGLDALRSPSAGELGSLRIQQPVTEWHYGGGRRDGDETERAIQSLNDVVRAPVAMIVCMLAALYFILS